jgi:hypothetical protein
MTGPLCKMPGCLGGARTGPQAEELHYAHRNTPSPNWVRHQIESSDFSGRVTCWLSRGFWLRFDRRWASMQTTTVPWDRNLRGGETGTTCWTTP